ncbi:MAG TPA: beta-aspartyl-peptidase, partial [Cryomorphaceae bacterium]|nr:beta-aspartyl-peptidase [Cryomorphaceae bacterium]
MRLHLLLLALPFFSNGQNHQQFKFDGPAIVIHGGAGGIERKYYTDEQIAEYDSALNAVLKVGYG